MQFETVGNQLKLPADFGSIILNDRYIVQRWLHVAVCSVGWTLMCYITSPVMMDLP